MYAKYASQHPHTCTIHPHWHPLAFNVKCNFIAVLFTFSQFLFMIFRERECTSLHEHWIEFHGHELHELFNFSVRFCFFHYFSHCYRNYGKFNHKLDKAKLNCSFINWINFRNCVLGGLEMSSAKNNSAHVMSSSKLSQTKHWKWKIK